MHSMTYLLSHRFQEKNRSTLTLEIERKDAEVYMTARAFGKKIKTATIGLFDPGALRLMKRFVEDAWVIALDLVCAR